MERIFIGLRKCFSREKSDVDEYVRTQVKREKQSDVGPMTIRKVHEDLLFYNPFSSHLAARNVGKS